MKDIISSNFDNP